MARGAKAPSSLKGIMQDLAFFYVYLFPCKIKTNVHDIIGNKKLPLLIPNLSSSFPNDLSLYKYEIMPKHYCRFCSQYCMTILFAFESLAQGCYIYLSLKLLLFDATFKLAIFALHLSITLNLDIICIFREKKCKVLKIIPKDKEGERCVIVALVCP